MYWWIGNWKLCIKQKGAHQHFLLASIANAFHIWIKHICSLRWGMEYLIFSNYQPYYGYRVSIQWWIGSIPRQNFCRISHAKVIQLNRYLSEFLCHQDVSTKKFVSSHTEHWGNSSVACNPHPYTNKSFPKIDTYWTVGINEMITTFD